MKVTVTMDKKELGRAIALALPTLFGAEKAAQLRAVAVEFRSYESTCEIELDDAPEETTETDR